MEPDQIAAQFASMQRQIDELTSALTAASPDRVDTDPSRETGSRPSNSATVEPPHRGMSRRQILTAAAAGSAGLLAASAIDASPAAAVSGNPAILGQANTADAQTAVTSSANGAAGLEVTSTGTTTNSFGIEGVAGADHGVVGISTATSTGFPGKAGVYGRNNSDGDSVGVEGTSSQGTGVYGSGPTAVFGNSTSSVNGTGLYGVGAWGVRGFSTGTLPGVYGSGVTGVSGRSSAAGGVGVQGASDLGVDVSAGGTGRIEQALTTAAGPPTGSGTAYSAGEQIRDANGALYLCVAAGSPGTWVRVPTVPSSGSGGATNVLSQPIRIYDTRGGAPFPPTASQLSAGSSYTLQVTGTAVGGISVPAGASAVVGTLTVTNTGATGYLSTFPTTPSNLSKLTSSINWSAAHQNLAAQVTIGLNSAGKCVIANGLVGGSTSTNVIFDAVAFIA
jgi:hypothetical protein